MRFAVTFFAIAWMSLLQVGHCQPGIVRVEGARPPYHSLSPKMAVDHVAIRVVTASNKGQQPIQATITRSGAWQREDVRLDGGLKSTFSDFERGSSVSWTRLKDGRVALTGSRNTPESTAALLGQPTGETQIWAGEVCDVYAWRPVGKEMSKAAALTCATTDGIELWQGRLEFNGKVTEQFHTMIVKRGPVPREDAKLPASVLDWNQWKAGLPEGDTKQGNEVALSGNGEMTIRQRGDWTFTETRGSSDGQSVTIIHPLAGFVLMDNRQGVYLSLSRSPLPQGRYPFGEPVAQTEATILGRRCVWYDVMPGVFDAGAAECRDEKGVILAASRSGWAGRNLLYVEATDVSDASPAEKSFAPPEKYFSLFLDR